MRVKTSRLELVAGTATLLYLDTLGRGPLGRGLDARVTGEWPPPELGPARSDLALLHSKSPSLAGWFNWYVLWTQGERTLCAVAGFNGPPDGNGLVELGYAVLPEFRFRGVATEVATALTGWALEHEGTVCVTAIPCLDAPHSQRVLEKSGFDPSPSNGLPVSHSSPLTWALCKKR